MSGLNGLLTIFKKQVEDASKITFIGTPGLCTPFAEFMSFGVNEKEIDGIDLSNPDTLTLERILEHIEKERFNGGKVKGDFSKNNGIESGDVYDAYKYVEELLEELKNRPRENDEPDEFIPS